MKSVHYELSVWDNSRGDVVKKVWDATEQELEDIRAQYSDEPFHEVVIDRDWEETDYD